MVCKDKEAGGLGIEDLERFNLTLIGKWDWRLKVERMLFGLGCYILNMGIMFTLFVGVEVVDPRGGKIFVGFLGTTYLFALGSIIIIRWNLVTVVLLISGTTVR
jgi:hypothetical protein